jgi:hypothetical protein
MPRARVVAAVKVEDTSQDPAVREEFLKVCVGGNK